MPVELSVGVRRELKLSKLKKVFIIALYIYICMFLNHVQYFLNIFELSQNSCMLSKFTTECSLHREMYAYHL